MRRVIAALSAAVAVLLATCSIAADEPGKKEGKAAPAKAASPHAPGKAATEKDPLGDVTHCKRVAQGTDGPERARLMTKCIRQN